MSHCRVGGKDIGEWLVAQGWARANGPDYADAEKTAREEKRGAWSPVRPLFAQRSVFEAGPAPNDAAVRAEVHLSTQSMTLVHRDRIVGHWPVLRPVTARKHRLACGQPNGFSAPPVEPVRQCTYAIFHLL